MIFPVLKEVYNAKEAIVMPHEVSQHPYIFDSFPRTFQVSFGFVHYAFPTDQLKKRVVVFAPLRLGNFR